MKVVPSPIKGIDVELYSRADAGLVPANPHHLTVRSADDHAHIRGRTHHWTGVGGRLYHPDPLARWRGIQADHMNARGFGDVAYNSSYGDRGNGRGFIIEGRSEMFVGAHALSVDGIANRRTTGDCFLEDVHGWTTQALAAFIVGHNLYRLAHGGQIPEYFAHRWWDRTLGKTICPGDQVDSVVHFCGGHF